jgi:hypothetical protein
MGLWDRYSLRSRLESGDPVDVYQYDQIPDSMRVRVIQIALEVLGIPSFVLPVSKKPSDDAWNAIVRVIRRSRGIQPLSKGTDNAVAEVAKYLKHEPSVEHTLDAIQEIFQHIQAEADHHDFEWYDARREVGDNSCPISAINELNQWFKEERIGYQFENGLIVRIDSQYAHAEAIKPALGLLRDPKYAGANAEFLAAHEHYRYGRHKECLGSCSNAFESTMKIICELRGWQIENNATASKLIKTCLDNNLLPKFSEQQLTSVRTALESGVPTIRNKRAGHGQGSEIVEVPPHFASYALHLTAANILLLVEAERSLPR